MDNHINCALQSEYLPYIDIGAILPDFVAIAVQVDVVFGDPALLEWFQIVFNRINLVPNRQRLYACNNRCNGMVYFVNCPNRSLQHFVPDTIYRPNVLGCHPHYTHIEENGKKRGFNEFYYDLVIETLGPVRKSGNHPPSVAYFLRHFTAVITFIPRITRKHLITWIMVLSDELTFLEVTKTSLLILETYLTGRSQKIKSTELCNRHKTILVGFHRDPC